MTRRARTVVVLLLLAGYSCSESTVCPEGAAKESGKCLIEDTGATADFTLPGAPDLENMDDTNAKDVYVYDLPLDVSSTETAADSMELSFPPANDIPTGPDLQAD